MGTVYKAEHMRLRRPVAIKVLALSFDESPKDLQRFSREMRILGRLQHPHIVCATDAGEIKGTNPEYPVRHYYVMDYIAGRNLEQFVGAEGPLPLGQACDLMHQVAWALAEVHKHDLIHRDIKPSNILVTPEGQAKLVDFGLVRHFTSRLTRPKTGLGSPMYMAPEQALDASSVSGLADIYALGTTLFWCLTQRPPFRIERNVAQVVSRQLTQPPPSARALNPALPPEADAVVARMMAVKPEDRYPSARAVMDSLLPFLDAEAREAALARRERSHARVGHNACGRVSDETPTPRKLH
jgi:serine/threonine protein kinase